MEQLSAAAASSFSAAAASSSSSAVSLECGICFCAYVDVTAIVTDASYELSSDPRAEKIKCGHVFCKSCSEQWLLEKGTCPVCRAPVQFILYGENQQITSPSVSPPSNLLSEGVFGWMVGLMGSSLKLKCVAVKQPAPSEDDDGLMRAESQLCEYEHCPAPGHRIAAAPSRGELVDVLENAQQAMRVLRSSDYSARREGFGDIKFPNREGKLVEVRQQFEKDVTQKHYDSLLARNTAYRCTVCWQSYHLSCHILFAQDKTMAHPNSDRGKPVRTHAPYALPGLLTSVPLDWFCIKCLTETMAVKGTTR